MPKKGQKEKHQRQPSKFTTAKQSTGSEDVRYTKAQVKEHIVPVLETFLQFSTCNHMNEMQFECMCEYLNLLNHSMARRLFAAFDDDNTGAMVDYEFFKGLRTMFGRTEVDEAARADFAFTLLNTEVVDGQRDDRVDQDEINAFLGCFFEEVVEMFDTGVKQFEHVFVSETFPLLITSEVTIPVGTAITP